MSNKTNKRPTSSVRRKEVDLTEFNEYLVGLNLGITPSIHINGPYFTQAVVTIDLGEPLNGIRLEDKQGQEISQRLRRLTREVVGRDGPVGVNFDHNRGIFYSSVN